MTNPDNNSARQTALSVLATAEWADLDSHWQKLHFNPACSMLRGPETGLVALRGRIGGDGDVFNFGEATATRASVQVEGGLVGHATVLGRDGKKAKLIAIIDALGQSENYAYRITKEIIKPLQELQRQRDKEDMEKTAATTVDFFTLVRGEDA